MLIQLSLFCHVPCLCWLYVLQLCKALETFAHLYGHTQVPINFEVPRDEPWPISTWNVKLGMSLSNIVTKVSCSIRYPLWSTAG